MLNTLIPSVILLGLVFVPLGIAIAAMLWQRRWEQRSDRRSPISERLLHQAGAQARQKMDALGDDMMERLAQLMLIGPLAMLVILLPRVRWDRLQLGWLNWLVIAGATAWVAWLVRSFTQLRRRRRQWREGMLAEIAAAQELDRLQAEGCFVLHDVPAGDFNIDHVVVAPHAVFAIETKSRRKPGKGKASANVGYDGTCLQFPGWKETRPIEQARAIADWLAKYLRDKTGEPVVVHPVVCLPGWFVSLVKGSAGAAVRVINPKMKSLFLDAGAAPLLTPAQRNRIVHALSERYPELTE
ncbi:nuclease-related domain-containing protein [Thermomonas haemolytica]|uniref:Nuclease-like protein n=1 Tax=Thermomonas haemolytica TaxID=141949 RepID=A0A4R3MZF8_9GAMM|nr:nuclease-related domain-containing protein [Thermomonas haemolytica]TCT21814.1 nuclease-like protein [Thermomonas haemolytica]